MATYRAPEYNVPPLLMDWPWRPSWVSDQPEKHKRGTTIKTTLKSCFLSSIVEFHSIPLCTHVYMCCFHLVDLPVSVALNVGVLTAVYFDCKASPVCELAKTICTASTICV